MILDEQKLVLWFNRRAAETFLQKNNSTNFQELSSH